MMYIHPAASAVTEAMVLYRNVLAVGTLAWSSETPDGYAANALGPQTNDFWTAAAMPATLSTTLVAAEECDCAAIIAHTLGSSGATVFLEYYNGAAWIIAAQVTPTTDEDLFFIFENASALQWRFRFTGATVPHIGIAMVGLRLLIPDGARQGYIPVHTALDIELSPSITVTGQYVGTFTKRRGASTTIPLALQDTYWLDNDARAFVDHYNAGLPFIWASNPERIPRDASYCWRHGNTLRAAYGAGALYAELTMEVQAYVGT